ncbi:MAG: efflux RND transporter periplasmic adaptor subunit [Pirellulaceae bacterium]
MQLDPQTVDVLALRPRIRNDLSVVRQVYCGGASYLIEDSLRNKIHRVGLAEYAFISALDGRRTVADALSVVATQFGEEAFDARDALGLVGWLAEAQLVVTKQDMDSTRKSQVVVDANAKAYAAHFGFLTQRFPIFNPDRIVRRSAELMGRTVRIVLAVVALALLVFSGMILADQFESLLRCRREILAPSNWLALVLVWLGLKLFHEFGHAMACGMVGGHVRQFGIVLVLFVPMPYVDVSNAWLITSKWKRIFVSMAGVAVEAMIASLALLLFWQSHDEIVRMYAVNVIYLATITTLVFNLNPLMRFDGYYVLTDLAEMPNLATNGQRLLHYWINRLFWGCAVAKPYWPEGHPWVVLSYAIAAAAWRILVLATLIVAASQMFSGAGVALAAVATVTFLGKPVMSWMKRLGRVGDLSRRRTVAACLTLAALAALACWLPLPRSIQVPVAMRPANHQIVRAADAGFLEETLVQAGDLVRQGDVLCRLSNPELYAELSEIQVALESSRQQQRVFRSQQQLVAWEIESARETALRIRLTELQERLQALQVVATKDGMVVSSVMREMVGQFIHRGEVLCSLGQSDSWELTAFVPQSKITRLSRETPPAGEVVWPGQAKKSIEVQFTLDSSRVSEAIEFPELSSAHGGRLAVYQAGQSAPSEKLVERQMRLTATLQSERLAASHIRVRSGQPALVRIALQRESLAETLWNMWML